MADLDGSYYDDGMGNDFVKMADLNGCSDKFTMMIWVMIRQDGQYTDDMGEAHCPAGTPPKK